MPPLNSAHVAHFHKTGAVETNGTPQDLYCSSFFGFIWGFEFVVAPAPRFDRYLGLELPWGILRADAIGASDTPAVFEDDKSKVSK